MSTAESIDSTKSDISDPLPKRKMSDEALAKLAVAREKAAVVNRQRKEDRLKAKVEAMEPPLPPKELPPMDPIVVVEQSDSDEEQLEGPPGVLFVRRKRKKPPQKTADDLYKDQLYDRMFQY